MAWVASAIGLSAGLGFLGAQKQAAAAKDAASMQADAAAQAAQQQREMFDIINAQQAPYRQSGYTALNQINALMGLPPAYYEQAAPAATQAPAPQPQAGGGGGNMLTRPIRGIGGALGGLVGGGGSSVFRDMAQQLKPFVDQAKEAEAAQAQAAQAQAPAPYAPGYQAQEGGPAGFGSLMRPFSAEDLKSQLAPNYQFMLEQGLGATRQGANVGGGGSNVQRSATKFAEDYASNAYQNALQNYMTQQSNIYNRLSNLAGIGQTAQNQVQNLGQSTAANLGQLGVGAATALGAGQIGAANAQAAGLSGIGQALMMPMMMGGGLGAPGGSTVNTLYEQPIPAGQWRVG